MSIDLERRNTPALHSNDRVEVLNQAPIQTFALLVDFTDLTVQDLSDISILTGGGNRVIVKVDPQSFSEVASPARAWELLSKLLGSYRYEQLHVLVAWGFPQFELVVDAVYIEQKRNPFTHILIGRSVYELGMGMRLDIQPGAIDEDLRDDPFLNSPEFQHGLHQGWLG